METEGWADLRKKQTLVDAMPDVTRSPFKQRTSLTFSISIIKPSNFGSMRVRPATQCLKEQIKLPDIQASLQMIEHH